MASYMCVFPAEYLDELNDGIKILEETNRLLNLNNLEYIDKHAALLIGKGGIGKTHLLCDIINDYVDREIPAILLYGDMFHSNKLIDTIIMDNYFTKGNFDALLSWLNEYGDRYNAYIPICIDAINETTDVDYWNVNLPLFLAKIQNYRNIKLIISCRSIYLEEYLDNEKIHTIVKISHRGFDQLEEMALSTFCQYYGVNIDYETTTIPEFLNPLFLKMLCEIAQSNDDKTVIVDDIQTLMNHFFDIKNKIISKQFLEYFSVRDKVVNLVLQNITEYMSDNDLYSIEWKELRAIVSEVLEQFGIKEKTARFIKLLISENLLREAEEKEVQITFSYQKFYEFLYSKKYIDRNIESIVNAVETHKITLGTLSLKQISRGHPRKKGIANKPPI